jgi:hypothetical protein
LLDLDSRVRPNRKDVAAKVLDGEAIMIDLKKGTYYSLDGAGGLAWELVETEHTLRQIADVIAQRFEVAPEVAGADVRRLVEEMLSEGLVERVHEKVTREMAPPTETPGEKLAYRAPELCIYRDMADLLALEPPTPGTAQEDLWQGAENEASD